MGYLEFCSNCGSSNKFGRIDGNSRFYCLKCHAIHYENPKPAAALVCPNNNDEILVVKRAVNPGKDLWCLPGGFIEKGETPEMAAERELKEETRLIGLAVKTLGTCSHLNTRFGDILLIGLEVKIKDWSKMEACDDAEQAALFPFKAIPKLAFKCHEKILNMFRKHAT